VYREMKRRSAISRLESASAASAATRSSDAVKLPHPVRGRLGLCPECGYTIRLSKKWADLGAAHFPDRRRLGCPDHLRHPPQGRVRSSYFGDQGVQSAATMAVAQLGSLNVGGTPSIELKSLIRSTN